MSCRKCVDNVPHNFEHGHSGYTNHRCRCDVCRTGNRDYMRKRRADAELRDVENEKRRQRRARRHDGAAPLGGDQHD
jgi:hypothetical protein